MEEEKTYADLLNIKDPDRAEFFRKYNNSNAIELLFNLPVGYKENGFDRSLINDRLWAISMGALALAKTARGLNVSDEIELCLRESDRHIATLDGDEWIPTEVMNPPDQNTVWVTLRDKYGARWTNYAWCDVGGQWRSDTNGAALPNDWTVTAWMQLPEAYKGDEE